MDSPSRRHTVNYPKPEVGLAEWTSKIKAMQREVDADEEAEQRKLEEEIRVSRLARSRRSFGANDAALDISNNPSPYARDLKEAVKNSDTSFSNIGKEHSRNDALRQLTGNSPSVDTTSIRMPSQMKDKAVAPGMMKARSTPGPPTGPKPDPVSLAAFIGGRATGPRLNKHAPQQDAHDPTQFEQRTLGEINRPHPVFGHGGIAMPGMVTKSLGVSAALARGKNMQLNSIAIETPVWAKENRLTRARSQENQIDISASMVAQKETSTVATQPMKALPGGPEDRSPVVSFIKRPQSTEPKPDSPEPVRERNFSSKNPQTPNSGKENLTTSLITTPSLARPIQPQVRPSPTGPQISVSPNASPAFLKPPASKDPTPSLSRLHGRGFVQSVVKKSSELDGTFPRAIGQGADSTPKKKPSVLDRWPPATSSPSPPASASPLAYVDARSSDVKLNAPIRSTPAPKSESLQQQKVNMPSSPPMIMPKPLVQSPSAKGTEFERVPSRDKDKVLGSSNTLISYIKPNKTGDQVQAFDEAVPSTDYPDVDELGMRPRSAAKTSQASEARVELSKADLLPGKPLTHLTKGRPKKPPKAGTIDVAADHQSNVKADQRIESDFFPNQHDDEATESTAPFVSVESPQSSFCEKKVNEKKDPVKLSNELNEAMHFDIAALPITPPLTTRDERLSPVSPSSRHSRIPSTVSRARVMEVAQAMEEQVLRESLANITPTSSKAEGGDRLDSQSSGCSSNLNYDSSVGTWDRTITPAIVAAEKIRSRSYDKYSSNMMPPLHEEKTPSSSPAGTSTKIAGQLSSSSVVVQEQKLSLETESRLSETDCRPSHHSEPNDDRRISLDVQHLWNNQIPLYTADPDLTTISVEVFSIVNNIAILISHAIHVFYDTETIAVIHRAKRKSTSLVITQVWGWLGQKCTVSEEKKLHELAKRFNTSLKLCKQHAESEELVSLLGGTFAIRQGSRHSWVKENSSMHIVRFIRKQFYIDELDFVRPSFLGFSFCISLLDKVWVWHGRGSHSSQRKIAMSYANALLTDMKTLIELEEGKENDLFIMLLGDDDYASANYWRWKAEDPQYDLRIWEIQSHKERSEINELLTFAQGANICETIFIIYLVFEIFVVVGAEVSTSPEALLLASQYAEGISKHTAHLRPLTPPVHFIVLPSKLPIDLVAAVRGMNENSLNSTATTDHMNLKTPREITELFAQRDSLY